MLEAGAGPREEKSGLAQMDPQSPRLSRAGRLPEQHPGAGGRGTRLAGSQETGHKPGVCRAWLQRKPRRLLCQSSRLCLSDGTHLLPDLGPIPPLRDVARPS